MRVRYPDGHGILRKVLSEATRRGFAIDDLTAEPTDDRSRMPGTQDSDGHPALVAVTMHVRGKRAVSELAGALTGLNLVDAVVATDHRGDDELTGSTPPERAGQTGADNRPGYILPDAAALARRGSRRSA